MGDSSSEELSDIGLLELEVTSDSEESETEVTATRTICNFKVKNIDVTLVAGDLVDQQCEVIVTSITPRKLDFKAGPLSKSIAKRAGPSLQAECTRKHPQGLQHGELAILGQAGKLTCKHVFCAALPRHDKAKDETPSPIEILNQLVMTCLQEASRLGVVSIGFPALGTGYLMYPPKIVCHTLLQAMDKFSSSNRSSSLKTACIAIVNKSKNLKTFEQECKAFSQSPPTPAPKPKLRFAPVRASRPNKRESDEVAGATSQPTRNTPEFCRYACRRNIYSPSTWTVFTNKQTVSQWQAEQDGECGYKLVDVDQSTHRAVEKLVHGTWNEEHFCHGRDAANLKDLNYTKLKVLKVQRLENLKLFESYAKNQQKLLRKACKGSMFTPLGQIDDVKHGIPATDRLLDASLKSNLYPETNEGYFFHGTKKNRLDSVCTSGIDPRHARQGSVFGQAVYMAESSTKADQYADDRNDRRKTNLLILLLRTNLGRICLIKDVKKLLQPPCISNCDDDDNCDHERCDSVVHEGTYIFREFIVYKSSLVYPEFLVTYNRE